MPDNISKVTQLKEKDGTLLFPLTSALTKLDFANEVDLTSRNTDYTAPADGVLITDSGAVQVNKGEIIRNSGANTKFIPLRNVTYLPDEVTATDIPAVHDGANTNVQAAITDIDSDISSINASLANIIMNVPTVSDANSINTMGVYRLNAGASNSPNPSHPLFIAHLGFPSLPALQIAWLYYPWDNNYKLYVRSYAENWNVWRAIDTTSIT